MQRWQKSLMTDSDILIIDHSEDDIVKLVDLIGQISDQHKVKVIFQQDEIVELFLKPSYRLPKLILLSTDLKGLSGTYLLTQFKVHPRIRHIPIIMLSDNGHSIFLENLMKQGASGCLVKPFEVEAFRNLLADLGILSEAEYLETVEVPIKNSQYGLE